MKMIKKNPIILKPDGHSEPGRKINFCLNFIFNLYMIIMKMKSLYAVHIVPIVSKGFSWFCILVVMRCTQNVELKWENYLSFSRVKLSHISLRQSRIRMFYLGSKLYRISNKFKFFFSHGNQSSENSCRCFDTNVTNLRRFVVMPSCQVEIPYMVIEYCVNVIIRVPAENWRIAKYFDLAVCN